MQQNAFLMSNSEFGSARLAASVATDALAVIDHPLRNHRNHDSCQDRRWPAGAEGPFSAVDAKAALGLYPLRRSAFDKRRARCRNGNLAARSRLLGRFGAARLTQRNGRAGDGSRSVRAWSCCDSSHAHTLTITRFFVCSRCHSRRSHRFCCPGAVSASTLRSAALSGRVSHCDSADRLARVARLPAEFVGRGNLDLRRTFGIGAEDPSRGRRRQSR